jgi:hypothetical protein
MPPHPVPDTASPAAAPSSDAGHLIVFGDTALAYRVASELADRYRELVTVILRCARQASGPRIAGLTGSRAA